MCQKGFSTRTGPSDARRSAAFLIIGIVISIILHVDNAASGASPVEEFSAEKVSQAIETGVEFLWSRQQQDGSWPSKHNDKYPVGPTALAAYALLECGQSPQDPRMQKTLEWLAKRDSIKTYSLALRCNAWQVADMTTNKKYRNNLKTDARRLWNSANKGSYHYISNGNPARGWDNSNSQYGLLGVWAAAREDVEVPRSYWQQVWDHWKSTQNPDGGWGYIGHGAPVKTQTRATMTAAGVASLFVCMDNLSGQEYVNCTGGDLSPVIKRGLKWLDDNFTESLGKVKTHYYYLYGIERVALASGYKYFGTTDWYKIGAADLIKRVRLGGKGGWGGSVVNTSFALLFLARGQNPVLFNKLQYPGMWNNRPRDLAAATRWITRTFERTVNWQIVNLRTPVADWHDAPILYIAGSQAPKFTDEHLEKIRSFVHQGGTILSVTECGGRSFSGRMRQVYQEIFEGYRLNQCPRDHEVYNVHFKIPPTQRIFEISNGIRPLAIHSEHDLAMNWQNRRFATTRDFQMAANIAIYVTGSLSDLPHRGTTHWPQKPRFTPKRTVKLLRVKHDANWNPEPLAYERLGRLMGAETATKLDLADPVDIKDLPQSDAQIAAITGTDKIELTDAQHKALKQYVASGGVLFIDAAGGSRDFARAMWNAVTQMYGATKLSPLSPSAKIYNIDGYEIQKVRYRRRTQNRMRTDRPRLYAVMVDQRPAIIFSRLDVTGGLLGQPGYTIDGYDPQSAYEIMRNVILAVASSGGD